MADDDQKTLAEDGRDGDIHRRDDHDESHIVHNVVGTVLGGRYRIDGLIGTGGMATICRAHCLWERRDRAIKFISARAPSPDALRRFSREAQLITQLCHPNIVATFGYGTTEAGLLYLVMELLSGVDLTELLYGRIDEGRAVRWALQILRGLEHAHERGVVHRDLKPRNIFVTEDHEGAELLRILDFGLARALDSSGGRAPERRQAVIGTPPYMSPEQCLGMPAEPTSDLYSLGVILYEMVAGIRPFDDVDPIKVLRMHITAEPPPLPTDVSPELTKIIDRLLSKRPRDRFPDARSVRVRLDRYPLHDAP